MKALNSVIPKVPNSFQAVQRTVEKVRIFKKNCNDTIPCIAKKFNWYVESLIKKSALEELFEAYPDETKVNEILIQYYKENTTRIFDDLKKDFPNRSNIFDEIFFAHNNGFYYLSCIAFMTQVDGIVYDFFSGKNYFHGNFFNETIKILKTKDKTIGVIFLEQLFNDELPIKLSQGQRQLEFKHLNRHQIIHGETIDFNTEINSLKALSLLATLAFNLKYLDDILGNDEIKNNK